MLEIDDNDRISKYVAFLAKTFFEIVRNTLIVASIGYFYEKTKINAAWWILFICQIMLTMYISSMFTNINFSKSFFADTRGGRIFRLIISGMVFFPVSTGVIYGTTSLVELAVKAQSSDIRCTIPFSAESRNSVYGTRY